MIGSILQQLEVALLAILFSILFMYQNNRKTKNRLSKKAGEKDLKQQ